MESLSWMNNSGDTMVLKERRDSIEISRWYPWTWDMSGKLYWTVFYL